MLQTKFISSLEKCFLDEKIEDKYALNRDTILLNERYSLQLALQENTPAYWMNYVIEIDSPLKGITMETTVKHIRISITSERYEVAASLFDSVYGDLAEQVGGNVPPTPRTPAEELIMGIFSDDLNGEGDPSYLVKPANPANEHIILDD